ncbi:ferric reductase-like transmembrane domain-containing protein [Roseibium marinum]|uniref:Ferric reductase like protein n=1 Tax=Roseibium marinum TaxID=281252 RepID=A0A2S3V326_9HYPH|nr:ferric reductase-like transmembrane domain-containing protein [Roseibium marinum]POF34173.1 ferric reductase like protein [Roseibium marinum]
MPTATRRARAVLIWAALAAALLVPLAAAAASPLLQWRQPVYIAAGFAGIIAMALLLLQPLLAGGYLPGLAGPRGRRIHRWTGGLLVAVVIVHVAGLWITSPPDVIDALLFRSPTPFSVWGVIAMWAVFAAAVLAIFRRRLRPRVWRPAHTALAVAIVTGSVVHALLIEGTMETLSKAGLCALVVAATVKVAADLKVWAARGPRRGT